MKFLVTALFFVLYWASPLQVSAKVVFAHKTVVSIAAKIPGKGCLTSSGASAGSEILNTSQQASLRFHPNYELDKYFKSQTSVPENNLYSRIKLRSLSFSYCRSIGLILIFPEHYFF